MIKMHSQNKEHDEKYKKRNIYTNIQDGEMTVKLVYEVHKKISAKEEKQ